MPRHQWEKAWADKKFQIVTLEPSVLVKKYSDILSPGDLVLDIGCGNGRNSIFLAQKGCVVEAMDVADVGWHEGLSPEIKNKIAFTRSNIKNYNFRPKRYKAVVVARVIQYLNTEELDFLLEKIADSLQSDGFMLLSYNTAGGIFDRGDIDVPKYHHKISDVKKKLAKYFSKIIVARGGKENSKVNYSGQIKSYDIWAGK
ncbi:MAG: hypothetical protein QG665_139 [Patescibacteria group bacterium]|nr:hypothetical protein [Patescibacteria group bacterium]